MNIEEYTQIVVVVGDEVAVR